MGRAEEAQGNTETLRSIPLSTRKRVKQKIATMRELDERLGITADLATFRRLASLGYRPSDEYSRVLRRAVSSSASWAGGDRRGWRRDRPQPAHGQPSRRPAARPRRKACEEVGRPRTPSYHCQLGVRRRQGGQGLDGARRSLGRHNKERPPERRWSKPGAESRFPQAHQVVDRFRGHDLRPQALLGWSKTLMGPIILVVVRQSSRSRVPLARGRPPVTPVFDYSCSTCGGCSWCSEPGLRPSRWRRWC